MANWRQIQGRIRRARTSADPLGKLTELFEKTRDAMVAFEAGSFAEKAGQSDQAIRWYTTAAERFRRAEWRTKASDALARLGAPAPESKSEPSAAGSASPGTAENEGGSEASESFLFASSETAPGPESQVEGEWAEDLSATQAGPAAPPSAAQDGHRRRRRGRRGGRRHKRRSAVLSAPGRAATPASRAPAESSPVEGSESIESSETTHVVLEPVDSRAEAEATSPFPKRVTYIRAGEPALASRFAHLESLLRRLVSSPLHRIEEIAEAPAGPGVFLLSDSDLMTNYYVEACQTLRVGAGQLTRSSKSGRAARNQSAKGSLRAQLAEHLEISEAKVGDYLKKHCVVRWLQLDEEAPYLAHFAIAVLRPALNLD